MRRLPDFFELRLDALGSDLSAVERILARLSAPLILTARHPAEGGLNNLSASDRCALLTRFLPYAAYVDVELRSAAQLRPILVAAEDRAIKRIISVHDLRRTPTLHRMEYLARSARALAADIFKIATRTDVAEDCARLAAFFEREKIRMNVSAMGLGKLGRISRISLARRGSVLNYAHLGNACVEGQLSLKEMMSALREPRSRRTSCTNI